MRFFKDPPSLYHFLHACSHKEKQIWRKICLTNYTNPTTLVQVYLYATQSNLARSPAKTIFCRLNGYWEAKNRAKCLKIHEDWLTKRRSKFGSTFVRSSLMLDLVIRRNCDSFAKERELLSFSPCFTSSEK